MNSLHIHYVTSATYYRMANDLSGDGNTKWTEILITVKDGPSTKIVLFACDGGTPTGNVFEVA